MNVNPVKVNDFVVEYAPAKFAGQSRRQQRKAKKEVERRNQRLVLMTVKSSRISRRA